jgi:signal peptidase I
MSKQKPQASRQPLAQSSAPGAGSPSGWAKFWPNAASIRETIESVAIAFVLAFLIRTFEAEAFVIPTGSMAPTLMGRHKDLQCPECGHAFQVSASEEVEKDGSAKAVLGPGGKLIRDPFLIDRCICPACGHEVTWSLGGNDVPSYSGDRILVNKFAYEFDDPKSWDVVVFKFPEGAQENYIKRLIGLPRETVRIHLGDIWKKNERGDFVIQRKPPHKLLAMLQPVFDNDRMDKLHELGFAERWRPQAPAPAAWTTKDFREYHLKGGAAEEVWLRYEHRMPPIWDTNAPPDAAKTAPPQLVTDLTAYDTSSSLCERKSPQTDQVLKNKSYALHWVGDLAVQCEAEVDGASGVLALELVRGGRHFQCRFDLATGRATFSIVGVNPKTFQPQCDTPVRGPGTYQIRFANCDRQLYLWVNEQCIAAIPYGDQHADRPDRADLQPAGIAASGADVTVRHLKIFRDIYYLAARPSMSVMFDYKSGLPAMLYEGKTTGFFSEPKNWDALDPANMEAFDKEIPEDKYFVLGDNSAKSADSRAWGFIPAKLMIGKAFFIYWPHTWNRIPYLNIPCPYFPNFGRMSLIH